MNLDHFIADCLSASAEGPKAVREHLQKAVETPSAALKALGEPSQGGINILHRSNEITILNLVWRPQQILLPHDHNMWSLIGIYTGREDSMYWRRRPEDPKGRIEVVSGEARGAGEVTTMGKDAIHSVVNPLAKFTGAIHIYGGDFFAEGRLEWDAEELTERPFDMDGLRELFKRPPEPIHH